MWGQTQRTGRGPATGTNYLPPQRPSKPVNICKHFPLPAHNKSTRSHACVLGQPWAGVRAVSISQQRELNHLSVG